jgi:LuxR family maltose regulon positive regulatory protein
MHSDLAVPARKPPSAPAEDPLFASAFEIPEPPDFMVTRPRLLAAVSGPADLPITLVVGPAGSGKTQLVASWVNEQSVNAVAWVTLDDVADVGTFWGYVLEALRRSGVPISPSLTPPSSAVPVDRSFLVRLVTELAELRTPVLLVLDGVSALSGQQWATDIEFVLRHTSPALRLVLVGRWDPPVPLHRYRLAGRLAEVRSEQLAFTTEEAARLLELHGVDLSAAGLSSLMEHTEGWAAGLRLFAMALQDHRDADRLVETITGNEATIAEYFVDEVLRVQPPHVRAFLLETSILDTFTPELAEAVTGRADARPILLDLERHNAFVQPAAEYSAAYRFHRLFVELLRAQLMCQPSEHTAELHRRAAAWFSEHGRTMEAVSHAVKARDWGSAATIAVEHYAIGELALSGRGRGLGALLQHMPDDLDEAEPAIVAAVLALADGSADRCAHHLNRAHELVQRRGLQASPALAMGDLMVGVLLAACDDQPRRVLDLMSSTQLALAHTPPEQLARHPELSVLMLAAKGLAQSRLGEVDAATVTLTAATAVAAPGCEYTRIDCLQHLALLEAYRGRLGHAEKLATEAIDLADRYGCEPLRRPLGAHLARAWVAMERYDVDAAGRHLRAADPKRLPEVDGLINVAFALVKSRRLQARGELRGAMTLLKEAAAPTDRPAPEWLVREVTLSCAKLLIVRGRPQEALAAVREFPQPHAADVVVTHAASLAALGSPEPAREAVRQIIGTASLDRPIAVEAWLVMARIAAQLGEVDNTREALRHALRHAAPESQRRVIQQVWAELRRVLRDDDGLIEQYRSLQGAAAATHSHGAPDPDTGPIIIAETLSRREMEVLHGMASMLPTEEIAATLYVSINTVKTHVRSILRKLSASRRNEAIRRARSLGLI